MHYDYHKKIFPNDVLVYIEEFNKATKTVIFDFIDSGEYEVFVNYLNIQSDLTKPTMVLLNNYSGRLIQEDTIYAIKREIIDTWINQVPSNLETNDSFLIRYIFESVLEQQVFSSAVSISGFSNLFFRPHMFGRGSLVDMIFPKKGKTSVIIRNVGQGNWNEISFDDKVKIVFDVGAPMSASKADVLAMIGDRSARYSDSRPILILSHWDKDHYHSLLAMTDLELRSNFSYFICRDQVPNLTSRLLYGRIRAALGVSNIIAVPADARLTRGGPTFFRNLNPITDKVVIYNSQYHKNRNISGLVLSVKTNRSSVILSGDAHYEQISRDILPHLNFKHAHTLVVPHHGGKAGNYNYRFPSLMKLNKAIISVGPNRYGHPLLIYTRSLFLDGFSIQKTSITRNDIIVNL